MEEKCPPQDPSKVHRPNLNYDYKTYRKRGKTYEAENDVYPMTSKSRGISFEPEFPATGKNGRHFDRENHSFDPNLDLQDLYPRPDYVPHRMEKISPSCYTPMEWKRQTYNNINEERIPLPPLAKNSRTSEKDVDNMLAKYNKRFSVDNTPYHQLENDRETKKSLAQPQQQKQARSIANDDPDFSQIGNEIDKCSTLNPNEAENDKNEKQNKYLEYLSSIGAFQYMGLKRSAHTFPFQETPNGLLVVHPDQV